MQAPAPAQFADRWGVRLSGLCALHCVATLALAGSAGAALANPLIHEVGLALAIGLGAIAFLAGLARHSRPEPIALGACGLLLMGLAVLIPHGVAEAALTVAGVALLAAGHWWNGRSKRAT